MAFQLAEAYVELSQRGFSSVGKSISGIGRGLTKMAGFASLAVGAVGGIAGVAGATGLIKLAADLETTTVQFETMLGSAEAAGQMIEDIQTFSASTPFQFEGLAASAKQLLAFGVSADNTLPTLRVIGDIAAVTGNRLEELVPIYGKVKAQGKLTAETINQFSERAIPLVSELAKQFGTTEAQIRELASQGKIGFSDVQEALSNITSEGGMAFEGMAKQSQTLAGMWSTFKDNITLFLTDIGTAIVEAFDLKGAVGGLTDMVKLWKGSLLPAFQGGLQFIAGLWQELRAALEPVTDELMFLGREFVGTWLETFKISLLALVDYWKNLFPVIMQVGKALLAAGIAGGKLIATFLQSDFFAWWQELTGAVLGWAGSVIGALADVISNWDIYWRLAWEHTKLSLANMWERVQTFFTNVVEVGSWMLDNWQAIMTDLGNMAMTVFENMGENLKGLWDGVMDYLSGAEPEFNWTPLLDGFKSSISELPELTKAQISESNRAIDALHGQLAQRNAKRLSGGGADASDTASDQSSFGKFQVDSGPAGAGGKSKANQGGSASDRSQFAVTSITGLADKMQQQMNDRNKEAAQMKVAERQAAAAENLANKAQGDGLRVKVVDPGAGRMGINPAFG